MKVMKCCLPLLVIFLVLVQHTGATTSGKKAIKEVFKKAASPLSWAADIAANFSGYERESQAIGAGGNIAAGAMAGFATGNVPGAVVGFAVGGAKWLVCNTIFDAAYGNYITNAILRVNEAVRFSLYFPSLAVSNT